MLSSRKEISNDIMNSIQFSMLLGPQDLRQAFQSHNKMILDIQQFTQRAEDQKSEISDLK